MEEAAIKAMEQEVDKVIEEAIAYAEASPLPDELHANVYREALNLYGGRP